MKQQKLISKLGQKKKKKNRLNLRTYSISNKFTKNKIKLYIKKIKKQKKQSVPKGKTLYRNL